MARDQYLNGTHPLQEEFTQLPLDQSHISSCRTKSCGGRFNQHLALQSAIWNIYTSRVNINSPNTNTYPNYFNTNTNTNTNTNSNNSNGYNSNGNGEGDGISGITENCEFLSELPVHLNVNTNGDWRSPSHMWEAMMVSISYFFPYILLLLLLSFLVL